MKHSCRISMRHLAFRFVRHVEEKARSSHVVDPYLDLREFLADSAAIEKSVKLRGVNVDVTSVIEDYSNWWNLYGKSLRCSSDDLLSQRELRSALLNNADGLLNALKLPNLLELGNVYDNDLTGKFADSEELNSLLSDTVTDVIHLIGRVKNVLERSIRLTISPAAIRISPPYFVRPAVVEACNYDLDEFPLIRDGDSPVFCLPGISQPTMISSFIKKCFPAANEWPISLYTFGERYFRANVTGKFTQKNVCSLVGLIRNREEELRWRSQVQRLLVTLFSLLPNGRLRALDLPPNRLVMSESSATTFTTSGGEERCLARWSRVDDYISRRAHIVFEKNDTVAKTGFLRMNFVELDISAFVDCFMKMNI